MCRGDCSRAFDQQPGSITPSSSPGCRAGQHKAGWAPPVQQDCSWNIPHPARPWTARPALSCVPRAGQALCVSAQLWAQPAAPVQPCSALHPLHPAAVTAQPASHLSDALEVEGFSLGNAEMPEPLSCPLAQQVTAKSALSNWKTREIKCSEYAGACAAKLSKAQKFSQRHRDLRPMYIQIHVNNPM